MTNANMRLCTVRVKLSESDPEPKQKLDEGEHIVKRIVEVKELYNVLQGKLCSLMPLVWTRERLNIFPAFLQNMTEKGSRSTLGLLIGQWDGTWPLAQTKSETAPEPSIRCANTENYSNLYRSNKAKVHNHVALSRSSYTIQLAIT